MVYVKKGWSQESRARHRKIILDSPQRIAQLNTPEAIRKRAETKRKQAKEGKLFIWNRGKIFNPHLKNAIRIRKSAEYRLWRKVVLERDKYKCIWCGFTGPGLVADHIKPFALFPELRFAIDNGRTLCANCHRKTDTYGNKGMYNIFRR